ncbi:hypothetical protein CLAFUW4_14325 [Fulvia fulva]|uniref:Uncharacterized protein n=1 Tax=Passalora fulva TaxID=5499 RepID=A0A9Q8PLM6_PASFU|nr:uncharacterized protein CLAFUR5_14158 [Fulvia fulva]KAK4609186.1 hypothetical protein CLAFUR4_14324 [Fulvia fulva]KAK4609708.1 hypothetical protein CLAFUR0_14328 [Fulvia fulva]UJO24884.1 hypothetical protein CLAFUR5_14158 [Fulvia fulva]WPV22726.1 hypothetical protein CLAFUW4_14325 [Fulvia fulva]WPV37547.1 hypothetical protein CLAFUW7_14332 [Fulvia fulva]
MGLIKSGMKYGSLAYIANQAGKAIGGYSQSHQQQQPQQAGRPALYARHGQFRDASGYLHQSWCNGRCGQRCMDAANNSGSWSGAADGYNGGYQQGPASQ